MSYRTREFIKYIAKCFLGIVLFYVFIIGAFILNADRLEQAQEWEESRIAQQIEYIELYE